MSIGKHRNLRGYLHPPSVFAALPHGHTAILPPPLSVFARLPYCHIAILLLLLFFAACTPRAAVTPPEMAAQTPPPSVTVLGPGDVLDFKFFYNPELNESETVRPDGKISLQLVGEVEAQDKTPAQLKDELVRAYARTLKVAEVAVIVRSLVNRKVYVGGDVLKPGVYDMPLPITTLQAIMLAGGFDYRRAEMSNVVVIRHKEGKRYGAAIDLRDELKGKEVHPFYLEAQDIVFVPRNKISQVGLWIDQYINSIIPRVGFTYSNPIGGSGATIGVTPPTTVISPP